MNIKLVKILHKVVKSAEQILQWNIPCIDEGMFLFVCFDKEVNKYIKNHAIFFSKSTVNLSGRLRAVTGGVTAYTNRACFV